jgi:nucleotide-binding universal stress UspA family protein
MSDKRVDKGLKKIEVASDFSDGSDDALAQAVAIAKTAGAAIEIVHILDFTLLEFPMGLGSYDGEDGGYAGFASQQLASRAEGVRAAGVPCETRMLEGGPAIEIVRRAAATGADLIVIGTHGRTGLTHAIMGSVAEHVIRHAP